MGDIKIVAPPNGPDEFPFLSKAVQAGNFLFVSGNAGIFSDRPASGSGRTWIPGDPVPGGVKAETIQCLNNIAQILDAAGASLRDIVKVNAFLRDIDRDFHDYNEAYVTMFPERPPARTTVQAKIYGPYLVEIECVAYIPDGQ